MFTFLTPVFLVGLASAAIPLLIHLSRSRRTKKMRFSTTRFFTDQFLRSYRMSRLKELWLLALRMALCGLFAAALARPLFLPPGQSLLAGQDRAVVLVLDNSASMDLADAGGTPFAHAQEAARRVLDELKGGDTAAIVLAGRRAAGPETPFPQLTPALADVRATLDAAQSAALGTDLAAAVRKAEDLLRSSTAKSKEVYVFSDLQDSGWELSEESTTQKGDSENLYFFVRVRPERAEDLAITAVRYAASRPMAGVPFSIEPHVRNHSDRARSTTVRLYVDDQKVAERPLDELQAGRWGVPRFHHAFATPGWHSGYVEIDDTSLAADDRRYFAFEVLSQVKVLAVNGAPSAVPRLDELFFLRKALTATAAGDSAVQLDVVDPAGLAQTDLTGYPLVVLANVESVPAPVVEKLEGYVDGGGSLLFFLGDQVTAASYNANFAAATRLHGGLLPGTLASVVGNPANGNPAAAEDFAFIGGFDDAHPALAAFSQADFGNLAGVTFKALWRVEPGESTVLMRTGGDDPQATGLPLLLEKQFGKGRVLAFAAGCDRDWTNFPVRPVFLPWVYRTLAYLAQTPLARDGFYATGGRVVLPVSASEGLPTLSVRRPDGTLRHATATGDPETPLVFDDTALPGVYAIVDADQKEKPSPLFAANLENYESDLTWLDDELAAEAGADSPTGADRDAAVTAGFKELLPGRPLLAYVSEPARVGEVSLAARRGFPLWDIVLWIVLAIALFEPWLANRISLKHYAKPKEIVSPTPVRTGRATPVLPTERRPAEATT